MFLPGLIVKCKMIEELRKIRNNNKKTNDLKDTTNADGSFKETRPITLLMIILLGNPLENRRISAFTHCFYHTR